MLRRERLSLVLLVLALALATAFPLAGCGTLQTTSADSTAAITTIATVSTTGSSMSITTTGTSPATTQDSETQVPEALREALDATGVPVQQITATTGDCGSLEYLVVLDDAGTSNNVNAALAFEQATALAAKGMPINALQVEIFDASGHGCFDMAKTLEPDSVRLGCSPDRATMSAVEGALSAAVDESISSGVSSLSVKRGNVSISQVGNGLIVAKVGFEVPDTSAAKAAFDEALVSRIVGSCRKVASAAVLEVDSIRVTVADASGATLLDYWENLESGSVTAYFAPGIGDGWRAGSPGVKATVSSQGASQQ
jgi:hypothetical protein